MVTMQIRHAMDLKTLRAKLLLLGLLFLASSSSSATCFGQSPEAMETIRVDSDLVDLKVSVVWLNPQNSASELQQSDFLVLEDGKPQEISFFAGESAPFDLVLLLDLSGSISEKLKLLRRSAKRFVEATRPMDRVAIVTFSDRPQVVSPLTLDRKQLLNSIDDIEKPLGGTKFWDSLGYVLDTFLPAGHATRRCAVVAMTDGVDNALADVAGEGSQMPFADLLEKLTRSDSIVFPIFLDTEKEEVKRHRSPSSAYVTARAQLAQLADVSGTRVYTAKELKDLDQVYDQVIKDVGTVYSVGYRSTNTLRDGKWRSVLVQVKSRSDVTAYTKRGYFTRIDQ